MLPHFEITNLGRIRISGNRVPVESESLGVESRSNPSLSESSLGRIRISSNRVSVESESIGTDVRSNPNPNRFETESESIGTDVRSNPNPNRFETESSNLIRIWYIPNVEKTTWKPQFISRLMIAFISMGERCCIVIMFD